MDTDLEKSNSTECPLDFTVCPFWTRINILKKWPDTRVNGIHKMHNRAL